MKKQYHILNGDALKEQFPSNIQGELIVARECLVDGEVKGKGLDELYAVRAKFLCQTYGGTEQDYYEKTVTEFQKILSLEDDSEINLWFEDDLFCQVNFWFVASLLTKKSPSNSVFLIRPKSHSPYGFGGLDKAELISIYEHRVHLSKLDQIAHLWVCYQNDDIQSLVNTARELASLYPFILPAVEAHVERRPSHKSVGRPVESLLAIMQELETEEFGPVFSAFNQRESIYGYGDLQVKRLFDEIKNKR